MNRTDVLSVIGAWPSVVGLRRAGAAMLERHGHRLGLWLALGAAFGFSFKAIFVKLAYAVPQAVPVDAVTLLSLRMVFALPVFLWVGFHSSRAAPPLSRRDWLLLTALGLLGYYGASILDFVGLRYITAGLERLILFTYPGLTLLFGVAFFGKRLVARDIAALALTSIGIAAAFAHDLHVSGAADTVWLGAALVFASSLSYAVYLVGGGELIARLGSARFAALAMAVATTAVLLHFAVTRPWAELFAQPWPVVGYAAAMALFSTVIPVFMQSAAIRHIGAGRAAMVGMLGPVATIFLAWWWLDEAMSAWQIGGAALVIAGVGLIGRR